MLNINIVSEGDATIITLEGDFDYEFVRQFLQEAGRQPKPRTIYDLAGVEYIDSSGLGQLLSIQREATKTGADIILVPSEALSAVLSLTRLSGIFRTANTVGEAKAMLATPAPS